MRTKLPLRPLSFVHEKRLKIVRYTVWCLFDHMMPAHDALLHDDMGTPCGPWLRQIAIDALHVIICRPEQAERALKLTVGIP